MAAESKENFVDHINTQVDFVSHPYIDG